MTLDSEKQTHLLSPAGELAGACAARAAARAYTFNAIRIVNVAMEVAGAVGISLLEMPRW